MLLLFGILFAPEATAQETHSNAEAESAEEADREQLRLLREALTEAVIAGDVEKQIEYVHADVVTVWQNNQIARGHDGLREFMKEISSGNENIFQGYTERPTSDEVRILPGGNAAIAYGKSVPHYKWLGMEFDLENRWTATLLKADDRWKIATYHVSGNIVDNPVLTAAKNSVYWVGGIALVIGLVVGAVGTKLVRNKREPAAQ
jgi:ketosteroid isomerase-like protein